MGKVASVALSSGDRSRALGRGAAALALSLCLALCVDLVAPSQSAQAQNAQARNTRPPPPRTTPAYNALFKRVFDDPTNVELTFRFAEEAIKIGDYEAAIGALERILFYNPKLARVKLQLGTLYFKLGAYKMAVSYFEQARAAGGTVGAEAERFIAEMDSRETPHRWSLFAQTGVRYQTNASAGPGNAIRSLGQDAIIDTRFAKVNDWNWFALFGASYIYDLKRGNEDSFEASIIGYYARQARATSFNFGLVEVQAGPRFSLPVKGASVKVYAIAGLSTLSDAPYFESGGAGISTRFLTGNKNIAFIEPSLEYRYRSFHNPGDFTTASQQTGGLLTAAVRAEGAVMERVGWFARLAFDRNETDSSAFNFNSYNRWAIDAGWPISFTLGHENPRAFVVTPTVGAGYVEYDTANPTVDPSVVRTDREWRAGVLFDAQIYKNYGLRTQLLETQNSSNLPNYSNKNFSVTIGPTARF